ncbi:hypothetical protein ACQY1Q_06990 [Tenacibaculum sp. TC6]|uniref:hypothetical protein n=1 Tax=Tenacibaculum sp. TC6 TaxID=3423223 RepID=UPI003D35B56F
MELTQEQIQRIEKYLQAKGIKYVDFKYEVLDHIITEIETLLNSGHYDFETAFTLTTNKWNSQLRKTTSWIFGLAFAAPEIVIQKAIKVFKPFYFYMVLISFLIPFLFSFLNFQISEETAAILAVNLKIITVLLAAMWLIIFVTTSLDQRKTIYSFIIKTQFIVVFYIPLILITDTRDYLKNGLTTTLFLAFTFIFISTVYFYKKHLTEKTKYATN